MAASNKALAVAACLVVACAARAGAADLAARLLEPDRHCRAGEKWERTLVVENLTSRPLACSGEWRAEVGGAPVGGGALHLNLAPRASGRVAVALTAPAVERIADMSLVVTLEAPGAKSLTMREQLRLYPATDTLRWDFLKDRRVGLIGASARLARLLKDAGARVDDLSSLDAASDYEGALVVAAPGAFDNRMGWSDVYEKVRVARLRSPLLVLRQQPGRAAEAPAAAQPALAVADDYSLSAPARKIFVDLSSPDFSRWRTGEGAPPLPLTAYPPGNLRRLVVSWRAGAPVGETWLLQSWPLEGAAAVWYCQWPLLEDWDAEPVCAFVLDRLLRGVLAFDNPSLTGHVLVAAGEAPSPALAALAPPLFGSHPADAGDDQAPWLPRMAPQPSLAPGDCVLLDAAWADAADPAFARCGKVLGAHVAAGGKVVVMPADLRARGLGPGRLLDDWLPQLGEARSTSTATTKSGFALGVTTQHGRGWVAEMDPALVREHPAEAAARLAEFLTDTGARVPLAPGDPEGTSKGAREP